MRQSAKTPQGLVYEVTPIASPTPGVPRTGPPVFVPRKLVPFTGDPSASPKGWVSGIETAGNNAIAGTNVLGRSCAIGLANCPPPPKTSVAADLNFSFPYEVGPKALAPTAYPDAATTNLFYFVNRAHDLFYTLGFDEAAGNFQQDNFGKGGMGGDPINALSQFGVAAQGGAFLNNSLFQGTSDDGMAPTLFIFVNFGLWGQLPGFFTDASMDANVVYHEYTHGVSRRLASRLYETTQGRAMGEAISDYFGVEFALPDGAPADGSYPAGEYFLYLPDRGDRTRPYSTKMEINPLTFANLGQVAAEPEVHADGEIFAEAIWEVRANLIAQFGDKNGRRRANQILVDAMKLAPPMASMLDMRDAILLADRAGFAGASQAQIWAGFAKRGMGALAQTITGNSIHISANFEPPSPKGSLRFYEDKYVIGEPVRVILQDSNNTKSSATIVLTTGSGDRETLTLRRSGSVFLGSMRTFYPGLAPNDGALEIVPGDKITAAYNDEDTGAGPGIVRVSVDTNPDFAAFLAQPVFRFTGETPLGLRTSFGNISFPLPFEFPFFEKKYSEVKVYSNGILTFGSFDFTPCNDIESLKYLAAVAPMWMAMRTNGAAQTGENVYVSRTADSVTFRWAGETTPGSPFQAPDAVNFSATLARDGRITFQYGTGNKNLATGFRGSACPVETPTVGISNGHESFVQLISTHSGNGSLESAPVVIWEPPYANLGGPVGILELPADGQAVEGPFIVQGVTYDADTNAFLRRADIIVDGKAVGTVALATPRQDYCQGKSIPQCPGVGFRRIIDPTAYNIAPGVHTLEVRVTNSRGVVTGIPAKPVTFTLVPGPGRVPTGAIEAPAANAKVSETVLVRGYASVVNMLVTAVDVLVDGISFGRAQYGVARADICNAADPRGTNCPNIGFQFALDTRFGDIPIENGPHTLQIRVLDESGRFTLIPQTPIPFNLDNANTLPPVGVLNTPKHNDKLSGMMRVSGHTYDPSGRILGVLLVVDGISVANIPYGSPRAQECSTLRNIRNCPNIGFDLDFDTKRLTNGPHTLSIVSFNDHGGVLEFPNVLTEGINIFVDNK
ncbi:MAG: M36 family metallopeptidase [Candidatus Solibacter usitatus]|nr:M36 family metallopeptidase [Candidatus Solibacter usitatus]